MSSNGTNAPAFGEAAEEGRATPRADMNGSAITIRGLAKTFEQFELGPLDMTVPKGAIYGFIGPNGAGKTTTIDLTMGMGREDGGDIHIFGLDSRENEAEVKKRIGYVSPDLSYNAWRRVKRLVHFVRKFYPDWDNAYCERLLTRLGLRYYPGLCIVPIYLLLLVVAGVITKSNEIMLVPLSILLICVFAYYFAMDLFVSVAGITGASVLALASYRLAPYLLDRQLGHRKPAADNLEAVRSAPIAGKQDVSIKWYDPVDENGDCCQLKA